MSDDWNESDDRIYWRRRSRVVRYRLPQASLRQRHTRRKPAPQSHGSSPHPRRRSV